MSIVISKMLKKLRREKGFSQENLASFAGVTVQAVSKWENGVSCPDISLLPVLARIFDVSIDVLLLGTDSKQTADTVDLPDDNILRIVQARGNKILARQQSGDSWAMKLQMPDKENQPELKLEIWGSCSIEGDVNGNIQCGDGVNCGNVGGSIDAGDGVNCGNVEGSVNAGDGVHCGNIGGWVTAEGDISCENIYGDVEKCEGDITCNLIRGEVYCEGDICYTEVHFRGKQ